MSYELDMLKSNQVVVESLKAIAVDQPIKDRSGYVDAVLEATASNVTNSKLIGNLYKEILSVSNVDYGKIPDSKGDLGKYKYYDQMVRTMDILNDLAKSANNANGPTVTCMNKLHNIILDAREDFVFGYKFNVDIIKTVYQSLVLTLYEVINAAITEVSESLKASQQIKAKMAPIPATKTNSFVKTAQSFIASYEKGEWASLMKLYRKNSSNLLGGVGVAISHAASAVLGGSTFLEMIAAGAVPVPALIIGSIIALFFIVRAMVHLLYAGKSKISDYARVQADLIKYNIEVENDQSASAIEKQKRMAERLDAISAMLEGKRIKTERNAAAAIKQSNQQNYVKSDITKAESISGMDFELV